MGIGDNIAGIMVRRVADLQKRDRDTKLQQQVKDRTGAGKSFTHKADPTPDVVQSDAGTLEEADRMLREIRDMVQTAASERDAAMSQVGYAAAEAIEQVPDEETTAAFSSGSADIDAPRTEGPETEKPRVGFTAGLPSTTFAQARALYFQNMESTAAEEPAPEGPEAADAATQAEQPTVRPGMPDREGRGAVVNLIV